MVKVSKRRFLKNTFLVVGIQFDIQHTYLYYCYIKCNQWIRSYRQLLPDNILDFFSITYPSLRLILNLYKHVILHRYCVWWETTSFWFGCWLLANRSLFVYSPSLQSWQLYILAYILPLLQREWNSQKPCLKAQNQSCPEFASRLFCSITSKTRFYKLPAARFRQNNLKLFKNV